MLCSICGRGFSRCKTLMLPSSLTREVGNLCLLQFLLQTLCFACQEQLIFFPRVGFRSGRFSGVTTERNVTGKTWEASQTEVQRFVRQIFNYLDNLFIIWRHFFKEEKSKFTDRSFLNVNIFFILSINQRVHKTRLSFLQHKMTSCCSLFCPTNSSNPKDIKDILTIRKREEQQIWLIND